MYVIEERLTDYLDGIDREISIRVYDIWRLAYGRGLVTAAELSRFLVDYEREPMEILS